MPPSKIVKAAPRQQERASAFEDPDMESPSRDRGMEPQTPDAIPPRQTSDYGQAQKRRSASPSPATPTRRCASARSGSASASRIRVNLDNFEGSWKTAKPINSPRSLAVCAKYGIASGELVHKPLEQFMLGGGAVSEAVARRRFEHAEDKRQQKLALLRAERQALIEQEQDGSGSMGRSSRRSRTPNGSIVASPARESARRLRESQQQRLSDLDQQRALRNREKMETLEVKTALAMAQKLSHEHDVKAHGAREHLRHVEETSANAKRLLANHVAERRDAATRHDLERAIRSLDAQSSQLRKAQARGEKHEEHLSEARQRAAANAANARAHHEKHVLQHDATAQECEMRIADLMLQRTSAGLAHDDKVREGHDRAQFLAAQEKARRAAKIDDEEAELEARLNGREMQTSERRMRTSSARRQREEEAKMTAAERAERQRQRLAQKQNAIHGAFDERKGQMHEDRIWNSELKRETVVDRAEEVARVRRAKEYERREYLISKQVAKGTYPVDGDDNAL
jgi:hypothetical protein